MLSAAPEALPASGAARGSEPRYGPARRLTAARFRTFWVGEGEMIGKSYFVHPSSYIDEGASIGEGTKIWYFCHVQKGARIGRKTYAMEIASSSIPAKSRIMLIISRMTSGFSEMPKRRAAILSMSPTVAPSHE